MRSTGPGAGTDATGGPDASASSSTLPKVSVARGKHEAICARVVFRELAAEAVAAAGRRAVDVGWRRKRSVRGGGGPLRKRTKVYASDRSAKRKHHDSCGFQCRDSSFSRRGQSGILNDSVSRENGLIQNAWRTFYSVFSMRGVDQHMRRPTTLKRSQVHLKCCSKPQNLCSRLSAAAENSARAAARTTPTSASAEGIVEAVEPSGLIAQL